MSTLIDPYSRRLNYLRISVTDRCNLKCMYCEPQHIRLPKLYHEDILRYEEIMRIVRIGVKLGISKVRITGGEPLIRKDICSFLKELGNIRELSDISLTTNGVLLKENLYAVRNSGIRRINISMDTLSSEKFRQITGYDYYGKVWHSILAAYEMGFSPIKINVVALRGINDDEFCDIARLTFSYPFHIRFIEYMPIGNSPLNHARQITASEIMKRLSAVGELIPVEREQYDGPAERFRFRDSQGEIGFISPLSRHFCSQCNRLRLTASGRLRPCLLSDHEQDIRKALRKGCSDSELEKIFLETVRFKPQKHLIGSTESVTAQMCRIGG